MENKLALTRSTPLINSPTKDAPNNTNKLPFYEKTKKLSTSTLNSSREINISTFSNATAKKKPSISDFEINSLLGRGSYAKCVLAQNKYNGKSYALKIIDKKFLDKFNKQHEVHIEKSILSSLSHPNIIKLNCTFQDKKKLYLVIEYCSNRDLGNMLRLYGTLSDSLSRFYAAEILSALEYMHSKGIYHRDIKPENIGINENMHLKLFDFGTADMTNKYFDKKTMRFVSIDPNEVEEKIKEIENKKKNRLHKEGEEDEYDDDDEDEEIEIGKYKIQNLKKEFVGTAIYVSPEVLNQNFDAIGPGCDLWALGIIIYLFYTGKTPFQGKTDTETFEKIKKINYTLDDYNIPEDAQDLIANLLLLNPKDRIGLRRKGYDEIKKHPFFKDIDFSKLSITDPPLDHNRFKMATFGQMEPHLSLGPVDRRKILNESDNNISSSNLKVGPKNKQKNKQSMMRSRKKLNLTTYSRGITARKFYDTISGLEEDDDNISNYKNNLVLEGVLQKKSPWFHYNTRIVKLFGKGVIEYYEPGTEKVKGTIIINEFCKVEPEGDDKFELFTAKRKYVFKPKNKNDSKVWIHKINEIIFAKLKKKY